MPISLVYQTSCCCPEGKCCAWVVPDGVYSVIFEIWGGGGGSAQGIPACDCCARTQSGGGGGYAMKTITVTPGDTYTICAGNGGMADSATTGGNFWGGSCGYCSVGDGCTGNASFVLGTGLTNFCASGGCGGCSNFNIACYGHCGCKGACGGQGYGGDINMPGDSGALFHVGTEAWSIATMGGQAGGPGGGRGGINASGYDSFSYGVASNDYGLHGELPGGGGAGHGCSSRCCCFPCGGGRGGHGLVKITW